MNRLLLIPMALFVSVLPLRGEQLSLESAPPVIVNRVAQLTNAGNYPAILAMAEDIEAQSKGVHGIEYFRNLLGVLAGLWRDIGSAPSFDRLWALRKIEWKILLAKHSNAKDAFKILQMKRLLVSSGLISLSTSALKDQDQFVALRLDAAALLKAYCASLQEWIIPGYIRKPSHGPMSASILDPEKAKTAIAEEKRQDAELTENGYGNDEQDELNNSLRLLANVAGNLVKYDFSWPPDDDQTVADLLDTFPPRFESRERFLEELKSWRRQNLEEYKKMMKEAATLKQ